jgi:hypothetical protein
VSRQLRRLLSAIAATALLALPGCAALEAPPDDTDLRLEAASHAFGGRYEYFVVHSSGPLADGLYGSLGGLAGPTPIARDLAEHLQRARTQPLRLLVTGTDAAKTLQVIEEAFAVHKGERLAGLELLFLGEPRDEARIRAVVESTGGRMRFAAY